MLRCYMFDLMCLIVEVFMDGILFSKCEVVVVILGKVVESIG